MRPTCSSRGASADDTFDYVPKAGRRRPAAVRCLLPPLCQRPVGGAMMRRAVLRSAARRHNGRARTANPGAMVSTKPWFAALGRRLISRDSAGVGTVQVSKQVVYAIGLRQPKAVSVSPALSQPTGPSRFPRLWKEIHAGLQRMSCSGLARTLDRRGSGVRMVRI